MLRTDPTHTTRDESQIENNLDAETSVTHTHLSGRPGLGGVLDMPSLEISQLGKGSSDCHLSKVEGHNAPGPRGPRLNGTSGIRWPPPVPAAP